MTKKTYETSPTVVRFQESDLDAALRHLADRHSRLTTDELAFPVSAMDVRYADEIIQTYTDYFSAKDRFMEGEDE